MAASREPTRNGSGPPDHSQSRFLCNWARKVSLSFWVLAFAALVIGGGFAEISSSGSPTSLETAVVRWITLGGVVIGAVFYAVGGRMRAQHGGGR